MLKSDVTEAFVDQYLLCLSQTGRTLPSRILRCWLAGSTPTVDLNPSGYDCAKDFAIDYQAVRLLKKFPGLKGSSDESRRTLALEKFRQCEAVCGDVNVRFGDPWARVPYQIYHRLLVARDFISGVLRGFSWDVALPYCDFGPGASIGVPRKRSHVAHKIGNSNPTVTGQCLALAQAYQAWAPHIAGFNSGFKIVRGSKVTTVPKDSRIDRVIAIEPLWNMFFQKGIGGLIRHRLRTYGLDLNSQAPLNRELARRGSITGTLATVDLSSASDSISMELVRFLLPEDWFTAIKDTRSWYSDIDGEEVLLKKVSSMGNGFTFELESLIFLALVVASSPCALTVNVDVAVFGDDIICPPEIVQDLTATLHYCGFKVNPEKSFSVGPFRESCGGHFFDGFDVTPFHLRKEITSYGDAYWAANQVREFSSRLGADLYCDSTVREAYDLIVRSLPQSLRRNLVPRGSGDDGLVASFDEATPSMRKRTWGDLNFVYRVFGKSPVVMKHEGSVGLLVKLYSYDQRAIRDADSLNRAVEEPRTYRLRTQYRFWDQQWPWIGPWL